MIIETQLLQWVCTNNTEQKKKPKETAKAVLLHPVHKNLEESSHSIIYSTANQEQFLANSSHYIKRFGSQEVRKIFDDSIDPLVGGGLVALPLHCHPPRHTDWTLNLFTWAWWHQIAPDPSQVCSFGWLLLYSRFLCDHHLFGDCAIINQNHYFPSLFTR